MNAIPVSHYLPDDAEQAVLVGRVWRNDDIGPSVVAVRAGNVVDITAHAPTMSDLLDNDQLLTIATEAPGESLGPVRDWLTQSLANRDAGKRLLAPCDLQAIKASGVTFAVSLLERVIEEQAGGDPAKAKAVRARLHERIGHDLSQIVPGSEAAGRLKQALIANGQWSQYLEVGIGPDAEIFSKAQPLSSIGFGATVGLHPASQWNNPEPEVVLAVGSSGMPRGATLGNDVNLRDFEGRSALLLSHAKDNNGSCAIGPFIRLFDANFTLDSIRKAQVELTIEDDAGFKLHDISDMRKISRDPLDLVKQTCGPHHQYPDGFMLFLGTMFSPSEDRDGPGLGFTHHPGDRVIIRAAYLGALVNDVGRSDTIAPWTFGIRQLYRQLQQRGLCAV